VTTASSNQTLVSVVALRSSLEDAELVVEATVKAVSFGFRAILDHIQMGRFVEI
jgi:hypothetical protein